MGKEMQGDNQQRRQNAREAREAGSSASEAGVSTGAAGQVRHLGGSTDHEEKIAGPGWGKQQPDRVTPDPNPHSVPSERGTQADPSSADRDVEGGRASAGGGNPGELSEAEARVFETIARLESETGSASVAAIAEATGLDGDEAEAAVINLVRTHDVVVQLPGDPDGVGGGPVYAVKARGG